MNFQLAALTIQQELDREMPYDWSTFYDAVGFCMPIIQAAAQIEAEYLIPVVQPLLTEVQP